MIMQYTIPLCMFCQHRTKGDKNAMTCTAYPRGIPFAILSSAVDHRARYQDDNGIVFVPELDVDDDMLARALERAFGDKTPV